MSTLPTLAIDVLRPRDEGRFHDLLAMFGRAFGEEETYTRHPPAAPYVERLLGSEDMIVLAALDGNAVIGGLVAYVLRKFEQERSEAYIYDLAVEEAHRRRGVATALIARLKVEARSRGAWVIFVQADPYDGPAISLYSRLGRREDVLHFDIPVD